MRRDLSGEHDLPDELGRDAVRLRADRRALLGEHRPAVRR